MTPPADAVVAAVAKASTQSDKATSKRLPALIEEAAAAPARLAFQCRRPVPSAPPAVSRKQRRGSGRPRIGGRFRPAVGATAGDDHVCAPQAARSTPRRTLIRGPRTRTRPCARLLGGIDFTGWALRKSSWVNLGAPLKAE